MCCCLFVKLQGSLTSVKLEIGISKAALPILRHHLDFSLCVKDDWKFSSATLKGKWCLSKQAIEYLKN